MTRRILFPLYISVLSGLAACGGKATGGGGDGDLPGLDVPGADVPSAQPPSVQPPSAPPPSTPPTSTPPPSIGPPTSTLAPPSTDVPSANTPSIETPTTAPSSTDAAATVQTLDLRRFDESNEASLGSLGCEYSERVKVYFRSREMVTRHCYQIEGGLSGDRGSTTLLDSDIERIQQAYEALRVAGGTQCQDSASWLSLAVVAPDDSDDRQLLDAEHAGCPLTGLAGEAFVQGLQQLYSLLAELQAK